MSSCIFPFPWTVDIPMPCKPPALCALVFKVLTRTIRIGIIAVLRHPIHRCRDIFARCDLFLARHRYPKDRRPSGTAPFVKISPFGEAHYRFIQLLQVLRTVQNSVTAAEWSLYAAWRDLGRLRCRSCIRRWRRRSRMNESGHGKSDMSKHADKKRGPQRPNHGSEIILERSVAR